MVPSLLKEDLQTAERPTSVHTKLAVVECFVLDPGEEWALLGESQELV